MVTSIEELKQSAIPEVDLPPFADGAPFRAKVKRTGLTDAMYNGKVANPLLNTALRMAGLLDDDDEDEEDKKTEEAGKEKKKKKKKTTPEEALETVKFMASMAESCLVDPSYKDLKDNGIDLTDEQIIAIYNCAIYGIQKAEKFCESP